jgi:ubiquinone/menaquinone biosynthesis C-methylase UbiE
MHLERPADVQRYLEEARRVLAPGGSVFVHIPVAERRRGPLQRLHGELRRWRSRRRLAQGSEHDVVRYRQYDADQVRAMFAKAGFGDVESRVVQVRSNGYPHHFWLARA